MKFYMTEKNKAKFASDHPNPFKRAKYLLKPIKIADLTGDVGHFKVIEVVAGSL